MVFFFWIHYLGKKAMNPIFTASLTIVSALKPRISDTLVTPRPCKSCTDEFFSPAWAPFCLFQAQGDKAEPLCIMSLCTFLWPHDVRACICTEAAPADSPINVILWPFPPKAEAFCFIHSSASLQRKLGIIFHSNFLPPSHWILKQKFNPVLLNFKELTVNLLRGDTKTEIEYINN